MGRDNQQTNLPGLADRTGPPKGRGDRCDQRHTSVDAAKAVTTTTVPIVLGVGEDPVKMSLVASLNRPERQPDGLTFLAVIT